RDRTPVTSPSPAPRAPLQQGRTALGVMWRKRPPAMSGCGHCLKRLHMRQTHDQEVERTPVMIESSMNSTSDNPDIFETRECSVRRYCRYWPTTFARSLSAKQWDEDGNEYLDFFSGAGALNYGRNNPVVMNPLSEYLQSGAVLHSMDMKTPA